MFLEVFGFAFAVPKLQKPLVFVSMLICGFISAAFSGAVFYSAYQQRDAVPTEQSDTLIETLALGLFFALLAMLCAYMVRRCFDDD